VLIIDLVPTTAKKTERPTYRTVVLLRHSEKLKLERIAAQERLSSGEIIRRFIGSHDALPSNENKVIEAALKIMSDAIAEANSSLIRTNDRLDKLHLELKKRDIR
jgi:hypothetical protein